MDEDNGDGEEIGNGRTLALMAEQIRSVRLRRAEVAVDNDEQPRCWMGSLVARSCQRASVDSELMG
uniref:Uncharacterized protein n=1 Tax=Oryza glumipatula TaxID=40148 RepID=A0A0E0AZE5_9ORYZ